MTSPRPTTGELLHALGDPDPGVRSAAVLALADVEAAVGSFVLRMAVETDSQVRAALVAQLVRHDRPEVVDGLVGHLLSDDAALRVDVVHVLSRTTSSTVARMPQWLADPDPDLRILAVMVLAELDHPSVIGWLSRLVREDEHANVVAAAVAELVVRAGPACAADVRAAAARFPDDPFITFFPGQGSEGPRRGTVESALGTPAAPSPVPRQAAGEPASGPLVLVVDDSATYRTYHRQILERAGYRVREAGNGDEALRAALGVRIDLAVVDVNMPVMDGFTFLQALGQVFPGRRIPVVMVSSEAEWADSSQAYEHGADAYVVKPAEPAQLVEVVRRLLAGEPVADLV
ncbi:MAG: response regulator [Actinobacteria bacterium]|nr:response regulator [Actinomycetota bacterium]